MNYLSQLSKGRLVLWCYLLWYLYFAHRYFDPKPTLWLSSLGISGIIGIALIISTSGQNSRLDGWQRFRLFLMPFCVSSFSALIKGQGFILVFSPRWQENVTALGLCATFCAAVWGAKRFSPSAEPSQSAPSNKPNHAEATQGIH